MTDLISLPRKFWKDREERDLPMPKPVRFNKSVVTVYPDDPAIRDYLSDAEYYSDIVYMSGDRSYIGLQSSARATVKAIKNANSA